MKELQKVCKYKVTIWRTSTEERADYETSERRGRRWPRSAEEERNSLSGYSEDSTDAPLG